LGYFANARTLRFFTLQLYFHHPTDMVQALLKRSGSGRWWTGSSRVARYRKHRLMPVPTS
jgi:hypothetical protein